MSVALAKNSFDNDETILQVKRSTQTGVPMRFSDVKRAVAEMKDRRSSARDPKANPESPRQNTAKLGRDIQAKIGEQLRAMYGDVVDQGVPDRFAELLGKIGKTGNDGKSE